MHVPLSGSLRTFRFAFAMRRADLSSYDVLHAHGEDYWMWRRRVPMHVRTLHGSCFEEALRIRGVKEKARMVLLGFTEVLASLVADRTVLISPQTRRWTPWVRDGHPERRRLRRGSRRRQPQAARDPTVLFVGTWRGRKRGAELARVVRRATCGRACPTPSFGWSRRMPRPTLPDGVTVLGRLSDEELADEYRRAWVFCLPSTLRGLRHPVCRGDGGGAAGRRDAERRGSVT